MSFFAGRVLLDRAFFSRTAESRVRLWGIIKPSGFFELAARKKKWHDPQPGSSEFKALFLNHVVCFVPPAKRARSTPAPTFPARCLEFLLAVAKASVNRRGRRLHLCDSAAGSFPSPNVLRASSRSGKKPLSSSLAFALLCV